MPPAAAKNVRCVAHFGDTVLLTGAQQDVGSDYEPWQRHDLSQDARTRFLSGCSG